MGQIKEALKLDSRNRGRVKHCPCGKSNRDGKFVPFLDVEKFGFCHSCNTTFPPIDGTIEPPVFTPKNEPTFYHSKEQFKVFQGGYYKNNLISFLKAHFTNKEIDATICRYHIGTSGVWNGATVFWQIDNQNKARHGKIMLYNGETGRRSKEHFNTVRNALGIDLNGYKLRQCLFGLHLLPKSNNIILLESEKSAIAISMLFTDKVIMATGGKGNFKYEMLKPLKGKKITAFPDADGVQNWKDEALRLKKYGFDITVVDVVNKYGLQGNEDILDTLLKANKLNKTKQEKEVNPIDAILSKHGIISKFMDSFDLEIEGISKISENELLSIELKNIERKELKKNQNISK
jgi:hypothetical protein